MSETKAPLSILMLITTPKLADKAEQLYHTLKLPAQYQFNAYGTASSEITDLLGLGDIDKRAVMCILPKALADATLDTLHTKLKLGGVNSGIAFTMSISGCNSFILRVQDALKTQVQDGKDDNGMSDKAHSLIAAIVNQGFSEEVMEAARSAGARGGTVFPNRQISDENTVKFWGHSVQEEKETVIILASNQNKLKIMQAISEKCGMHSEAKGTVLSVPVDNVMGIS